jgi:hypothetical protein
MAAYNFQKRFVEPIRAGTKKHTIRADRKDGRVPKIGEGLALYCGMRTKQCFKILPGLVPCTKVARIRIPNEGGFYPFVFIDVVQLSLDECERLARADGFDSFGEMVYFWEGRLPFSGNIIHWR